MKAILIGSGSRGMLYANYGLDHPEDLQIVGVADPADYVRGVTAEKHNIPEENIFTSWEQVFEREKFADAVFVCTQDKLHYAPTMAAIEKGYHVLVEKPLSPSPEECFEMAEAAEKKGVKVVVCHVLRYANFFTELKKIIDSGEIGEVVSVIHNENVGNTHQAHAFVRGHWRNSKESSPMILAKSCHDTDIVQWLIGKKCKRVSSFGSLMYFNEKNAPEGAPERCTDGCPYGDTCPYDTRKLYFEGHTGYRWWYRAHVARLSRHEEATDEQVINALNTSTYGKCIFKCDNDVVDHQVVNMEFEGGATAAFSMCAFTPETSRTIKIMGTKGQIRGHLGKNVIVVTDFLTYTDREIDLGVVGGKEGHGGGDDGLMRAFCDYINNDVKSVGISDIRVTAENHMISFAAEESRVGGGKVIEL